MSKFNFSKRLLMTKNLFIFLSLSLFTLSVSSAAVYKGQIVFVENCVLCHANAEEFVTKHTKSNYEKWMNKKGKPLADIHLKSEKAKKSHEYFKSSIYTKKSKHLREFLIEYAKDSGNIPVFN